MRLMTVAILSAASFLGLSALTPASAQAPHRRYARDTESITVIDQYGHRTTRITVRPRSFLDPGNNVEPYSQNYTNYYIRPDTYAGEFLYDRNDWRSSWSRMPIPSCLDIPGMCR